MIHKLKGFEVQVSISPEGQQARLAPSPCQIQTPGANPVILAHGPSDVNRRRESASSYFSLIKCDIGESHTHLRRYPRLSRR
jgi:hypothetical protein